MDRRQLRAARRADASGSGPTLEERDAPRFPGAAGAFALFGEVLMVGLLITIAGLAIVTLPAALAAGIRHLRRYVAAEASPAALFWQDVRKALPGGLVVGVVSVVLTLLLLFDIDLAGSGALPGGGVIAIVGWLGLAAVAVAVLAAAGAWTPEGGSAPANRGSGAEPRYGSAPANRGSVAKPQRGWRAAVRSIPHTVAADIAGALYLAATAFFVGVATWMLVPLVVPALGCAALAVVAIPTRRRRAR
jgi:hypothetical protein